jgi:serine/threonine protein kinase
MISYGGQVKVLDFGIAKGNLGRAETRVGVVKGKVRYMSPEQILSGPLDRRSDIFSMGLVMFECLTGKMLFENCSPAQIQYKMLHERLPRLRDLLPDIDPQLDDICHSALQFDANSRYPTAYVMSRELRSYLKRVGFAANREALAALMRERYGERATQRIEFLERVLSKQLDEAAVRAALGARPVLAIDLFGEAREVRSEFDEDATILDPGLLISPAVSNDNTIEEAADGLPAMSGPVLPPPPPLPRERSAEEFVDQTRMLDETRPVLEPSPPFRPVEETRKLSQDALLPPPAGIPRRTALVLALMAFLFGIVLGAAGAVAALGSP